MTVDYERVKHVAASVLNYATWQAMAKTSAPHERFRDAVVELEKLDAADAATVQAYAAQTWKTIGDEFLAVIDLVNPGGPAEKAMLQRLRDGFPWLDTWTFDVLCGVAYRYAMM